MSYREKYYTYTNDALAFVPLMKKSPFVNFFLRTRDIIVATIGLLFLFPFLVFIAIKIKRDSPGPVLFKGPRVGKNGNVFYILKFRTMYENRASYQGPRITGENDSRITKVGSWLRETKLNELPQLWNVLVGEMSLVGPRPEDPEIAKTWPDEVRQEIFSIRPGITSPASVLFRDEESMLSTSAVMETYLGTIQPNKIRLDQLYVRYRSLWVDFDVLLWTFLLLIPRPQKADPPERLLYGGLVARSAHYLSRWFFIDFITALVAIGASGLFWRAFGPFHLGFWHGVVEAIEFAVIFTLVGAIVGIQKIHWSKASPEDVLDLFISSVASTLLLLLINLIRHKLPFELIISGAVVTFFGMVITRYRYRIFTGFASRWLRFRKEKDVYRERVLIIGSGDAGSYAAWMLANSKEGQKYNVIGYLDDDFHKQGIRYRGIEVLGSTDDLEKISREYDVGIILFAIHNIEEATRSNILKRCQSTHAQVVLFPNIFGNLSEAISQNGKSKEKTAETLSSIEKIEEKISALAPTRKIKMLSVLEELQANLEESDLDQCLENINALHELINQIEEEGMHE